MTGIIELAGETAVYGSDRRILRVHKMRGMDVATGAYPNCRRERCRITCARRSSDDTVQETRFQPPVKGGVNG